MDFSFSLGFIYLFLNIDPLPPSRFEIKKEKISTTTLQVWWSPSLGKVDQYELQLFDSAIQKLQEIHVPGGISRNEETFANLIPGSKYTISISAIAGTKNSPTIDVSGFTGKIVFCKYFMKRIVISTKRIVSALPCS